jgi:hypothetical protein
MTTQTTSISELTVDELIELAWNTSGMLTAGKHPSPAEYNLGHKMLEMELGSLQRDGHMLRDRENTTLTFVAGTNQYDLPSDVLDVIVGTNDVVGTIIDTSGGAETIVTSMSLQEWMTLSTKNLTNGARPTKVLIEKLGRIRLTFWPTPDSSIASLRYTRINFIKGATQGDRTIDVMRTWQEYLMYAVAAKLCAASSLPLERVGYFRQLADAEKRNCLVQDQEHGNAFFRPMGRRY